MPSRQVFLKVHSSASNMSEMLRQSMASTDRRRLSGPQRPKMVRTSVVPVLGQEDKMGLAILVRRFQVSCPEAPMAMTMAQLKQHIAVFEEKMSQKMCRGEPLPEAVLLAWGKTLVQFAPEKMNVEYMRAVEDTAWMESTVLQTEQPSTGMVNFVNWLLQMDHAGFLTDYAIRRAVQAKAVQAKAISSVSSNLFLVPPSSQALPPREGSGGVQRFLCAGSNKMPESATLVKPPRPMRGVDFLPALETESAEEITLDMVAAVSLQTHQGGMLPMSSQKNQIAATADAIASDEEVFEHAHSFGEP